jgi:hypothetical protein
MIDCSAESRPCDEVKISFFIFNGYRSMLEVERQLGWGAYLGSTYPEMEARKVPKLT